MMIMTVIHHLKKYKDDNNDDIYDCNDNNDETNSKLSNNW